MADKVRIIAITGTIGALVGGALAMPAFFQGAVANEPAKVAIASVSDLFPAPFDPKSLVKYDVVFDDTISTETKASGTVKKIGYGYKTLVSIVTTPSGTYSSDALTSPNVRYPGIEVVPVHRHRDKPRFWASSSSSPYGTWTSSGYSVGSFIYYNYSFKPALQR